MSHRPPLLIVAAACMLVASGCEKEPPKPSAAVVAREQSPEPPPPPAAPADPIAAARAIFETRAERARLSAHAHNDVGLFTARRYLEENPSPEDGLRGGMEQRIQEHETALAKAEQKIAAERADWESKNWEGYPPPEISTFYIPPKGIDPRQADLSRDSVANAARLDYYERTSRMGKSVVAEVERQRAAFSGEVEQSKSRTKDMNPQELAAEKKKLERRHRQINSMLDDFKSEQLELAIMWAVRGWKGYSIPSDPAAPPPRPWSSPK